MNKFILNIKLKENFGIDINIIYWDKRFLWSNSTNIQGIHDYFNFGGFSMYSFGNGYITKDQFVIPELKKYYTKYNLSHNFSNDLDRYEFLKNLYHCLNEWGKYWNNQLKYNEKIYNDNIIVNGNFWIM